MADYDVWCLNSWWNAIKKLLSSFTASSLAVWPATTVPPSALGKEKEAFRRKDGHTVAGQTSHLA